MKLKSKVLIFVLISMVVAPAASAQSFDKNYIISDEQMTDYESMGMFDIIQFLKGKGGTLYTKKFLDEVDGKMKSGPALIYEHCQENKINPQVMLVTLQKEQSLVDNGTPSQYNYDWATGWAVCDGCSLSDSKVAKYKGFAKQVEGAASGYRWYLDQYASGQNKWLIWPDKATTIDGEAVVPSNQATAALYNYTPHFHGNENFNRLWNNWFSLSYPDGSLLYAEGEDDVWVILDGYRRTFKSRAVLESRYNFDNVMIVSKAEIDKYTEGPEIKFANYSLLRSANGRIYLLVDDEKRWIESMEVFRTLGFNMYEVDEAKDEDLSDYNNGQAITMASAYPTGGLLQNNQTGGVYWVKDGVKRGVIDRTVMDINYPSYKISPVAPDELQKYPNEIPVKIKDGTLIKSSEGEAVYVISDGLRRPISSPQVFEQMGYEWDNIKLVPEKVVGLHEEGEVVSISF